MHDFVFFEGTVISGSSSRQSELAGYLLSNGPFQTGDFDRDGDVDADDWDAFYGVYQGESVPANNPPPFLDVNGDGVIDPDDEHRFLQQFKAFRFGADGWTDVKDLNALEASRSPSAAGGPLRDNLFDLDGDGDVDDADRERLVTLLDRPSGEPCLADLAPPFGVLDLVDINTFILGFISGGGVSDLAEPFGVLDLSDISAFVASFSGGCP
jgi:hypothetical protein